MLFYCDRQKFPLIGGFFIFLFILAGRGIIFICSVDNTLYSKCGHASNWWQQLELASELESDLRDTMDWGKKRLIDFIAGKTQLDLFDRSNNIGSIDAKVDGSVLEEKSSFDAGVDLLF